jgi:predicted CXXCH cytochrome family protein
MKKIVVIAAALILISSTRATAELMTERCVDCHVVHAWQEETEREKAAERAGEVAVASATGRAVTSTWGAVETQELHASILGATCESCHANAGSNTLVEEGLNTVPIVKNGQEPLAPLAGGNFYYSSGQLHLEKAGGSCTSCHRDVRHHATSSGYRFLGSDIEGIGDPLYEHGEGHNIYKSGDQYCSACHGNFCGTENQRAAEGWIRHPTNTPLPGHGEYGGYVYRKDVPVGYPDPNNPERSTARVMCMSCHRPHGTPYPDLLRWDYSTIMAQGGESNTGCFACHSQKDKEYQAGP